MNFNEAVFFIETAQRCKRIIEKMQDLNLKLAKNILTDGKIVFIINNK